MPVPLTPIECTDLLIHYFDELRELSTKPVQGNYRERVLEVNVIDRGDSGGEVRSSFVFDDGDAEIVIEALRKHRLSLQQ
jgi:hypothetical protein